MISNRSYTIFVVTGYTLICFFGCWPVSFDALKLVFVENLHKQMLINKQSLRDEVLGLHKTWSSYTAIAIFFKTKINTSYSYMIIHLNPEKTWYYQTCCNLVFCLMKEFGLLLG